MMYCIQHSIVNGEKNYISQAVDSVQLESTQIKEYAENRIKETLEYAYEPFNTVM